METHKFFCKFRHIEKIIKDAPNELPAVKYNFVQYAKKEINTYYKGLKRWKLIHELMKYDDITVIDLDVLCKKDNNILKDSPSNTSIIFEGALCGGIKEIY